ncbi:short-chain dehydrogenase [Kwoniella heveanensis BCC8398]|uniref:Short-chain dehydrogenase n=1 Tax=Kwoniella heveanensis BCC8398 TaxID=1296120 RepID=A0A1B9GNF9_9TREE|nr:short-chain dehydrogenase [Kwoniella heveanensis BCC8398]
MTSSPARKVAVILGVGSGLSRSIAVALAPTHSLLLLSRSLPDSLPKLNLPNSIPQSNILALSSDGTASSLDKAFKKLKETWPEGRVDVGVYNVNEKLELKGFLDRTEADLRSGLDSGVVGAWNLAQAIIPHFLSNSPDDATGGKGTLLYTGATMSIKSGAKFSSLAPGMFARRALAQSLAREFGPQGVHVGHVIIDGVIDTERVAGMMGEDKNDTRLKPDDIAQVYLSLINQPKSAWTQELDVR